MRWIGLAAVLAASAAQAQTADGPAEAPAPVSPEAATSVAGTGSASGVIVYPPAFFAASQPTSAFDMVLRVPGFSFDGGDNEVRGYAGAIGNVLIDGAPPSSKSEELEETIKRISASSVERIELIRGGAPGIDMRGRTVLVNIVRKTNTAKTGLMAVAANFFADGRAGPAIRLEGSVRSGARSIDGGVLLYNFVDNGAGEGPRITSNPSGGVIGRAFHDQTGGGYGVQLKSSGKTPVGNGELRLNGNLTLERYLFDFVDTAELPAPLISENNDNFGRVEGEVGFNYDYKFGSRLSLETLGLQRLKTTSFTSQFDQPGFTAQFTEDADSGESILRSTLKFRMSDVWSFEAGGEAAFNFLESATTYAENGQPVTLPAANVRVEERRGEVFAQATWRLSPTLTLEGGARVETSTISQTGDSNSEQSFVYPKPRLLATWQATPADQLRLRFEREVGQLDFGDFVSSTSFSTGTVDAGNPDLHPDTAWVAEAAYERRFWGKGAAVFTYRYKQITDPIDRVPVFVDANHDGLPDDLNGDGVGDVFDAPGNIGDATVHEVAVDLSLPLDRLGIKGGLLKTQGAWRFSDVVDPTTGENRELSGLGPRDLEFHFSQDLPDWRLTWGADVFLGERQTYYRLNEVRKYYYQSFAKVFVDYKIQPNLSIYMEVANLLARDIVQIRDVYNGPRDTGALVFHEDRRLGFQPFVYLRLRRTFG